MNFKRMIFASSFLVCSSFCVFSASADYKKEFENYEKKYQYKRDCFNKFREYDVYTLPNLLNKSKPTSKDLAKVGEVYGALEALNRLNYIPLPYRTSSLDRQIPKIRKFFNENGPLIDNFIKKVRDGQIQKASRRINLFTKLLISSSKIQENESDDE